MTTNNFFSVFAPLNGVSVDITQVPDDAFAQKMLGDGIAIKPFENIIYAPFSGNIKTLHKSLHAIVIENQGFEILIHIGIDTVTLNGQGFKTFVKEGQSVKLGDKLIEFDRDFIKQQGLNDIVVILVTMPFEAPISKEPFAEISKSALIFKVESKQEIVQDVPCVLEDKTAEKEIIITDKNGLHARPAGQIATLAKSFKDTEILLKAKNRVADARSVVELLGLSLMFNDKALICCKGACAQDACNKISSLMTELTTNTAPKPTLVRANQDGSFNAVSVFGGQVFGACYVLKKQQFNLQENSSLSPEEESSILLTAINKVKNDLHKERHSVGTQSDREEILLAHLTILEDPFLQRQATEFIKQGKTASFAFSSAIKNSIDILTSSESEILRTRVNDFIDIETRILAEITGSVFTLPNFTKETIIVAEELLSHQLQYFNDKVSGVIMVGGSSVSHVAIMLKNMGLPSVASAPREMLDLPQDTPLFVDSIKGLIFVNPSNLEELKQKAQELKVKRIKNLSLAKENAITIDGIEIKVTGNIGSLPQAEKVADLGGKGIGLVRTEFLFADSKTEPTEEEQYTLYQKIVNAQLGEAVTIRTLDVGADKPLSFIEQEKEDNPLLGRRGIRVSLANLEIFRKQVRAIMRVKPYGIAKIMLPMVSFVKEFIVAKEIIEEERKKLGIDKVVVGMMIETPASALMVESFAKYVDFFSIGTNDLTQYTLALDRTHPTLSFLADSLNPSILRLIDLIVKGASKYNKPVSVCGAMASEYLGVIALLGLGIKEISVASPAIADIKALIRTLNIQTCKETLQKCLNLESVEEIKEELKKLVI